MNFKKIGSKVVKAFISGSSGEAVTRRRFGPSATVNFRRVEGGAVETPGIRVFMPPTSASTQRPEEGTRRSGSVTIYSIEDFRAADDKLGARGDELVREDGSVYVIESVNDYAATGGFYESTGVLKAAP